MTLRNLPGLALLLLALVSTDRLIADEEWTCDTGPTLISNGWVWNGGRLDKNFDILIADGRITKIGPAKSFKTPKSTHRLDKAVNPLTVSTPNPIQNLG